mmetsp:Transcript_12081/g.18657  ORF Transcript_12081/g.18657 Transcript_12081/m.18657 type:complete len:121 (-) Transcript_12081:295-657(-)
MIKGDNLFTLEKWASIAQALWRQTELYTGQLQFKTLEEKEQDKMLAQKVGDIIVYTFDLPWDDEIKPQLKEKLTVILKETKRKAFDVLSKQMVFEIAQFYDDKYVQANFEFDQFCSDNQV